MSAEPMHSAVELRGQAAARALRGVVRESVDALFARFIDQLIDGLSERAADPAYRAEERELRGLLRRLQAERGQWIEHFGAQIDARLIGDERGPATQAGPGDSLGVAFAQQLLRAEAEYRRLLTELDARINRVRLQLYIPIRATALSPTGLSLALQHTAATLRWPAQRLGLLVGAFARDVLAALEPMYRRLIDEARRIASQQETRPAAPQATAAGTPEPPSPSAAAETKPEGHARRRRAADIRPPADTRHIDPATEAMLRRCALDDDGEGYNDSLLAADLLALMDDRPLPGLSRNTAWIPLQRISLAGHFLNELIEDPMVPGDLRPQHEAMRLPLVKSAIADESVFTAEAHPLASLINELMMKSAASRLSDNPETRRMAELLQQVLLQFDLAPDFVREALATAQPISESQVQRFFALQKQQAEQRRDFVIDEARRIVAGELERSTFGRDVPQSAVRFLNRAWGPLLTKRLIQFGAAHRRWKEALEWTDALIDRIEARRPDEPPPEDWATLLQHIRQAMLAAGAQAASVDTALDDLRAAWQTPRPG